MYATACVCSTNSFLFPLQTRFYLKTTKKAKKKNIWKTDVFFSSNLNQYHFHQNEVVSNLYQTCRDIKRYVKVSQFKYCSKKKMNSNFWYENNLKNIFPSNASMDKCRMKTLQLKRIKISCWKWLLFHKHIKHVINAHIWAIKKFLFCSKRAWIINIWCNSAKLLYGIYHE